MCRRSVGVFQSESSTYDRECMARRGREGYSRVELCRDHSRGNFTALIRLRRSNLIDMLVMTIPETPKSQKCFNPSTSVVFTLFKLYYTFDERSEDDLYGRNLA